MKLSKRKIELMLVDIAIIICVYYMTALVGILRLHSIVLNGELNLTRLTALVIMLMTGRILCGTAISSSTPTAAKTQIRPSRVTP